MARHLGERLTGGEVIALEGELGAGKTLFVKGLAAGLGAAGPVTSPTFSLLHIYEGGRLPLFHFDVYRLPSSQAIEELGYEEYFYGLGVTAVEWSDLIKEYLPKEYLLVRIAHFYREDKKEARRLELIPYGEKTEEMVEELKKNDCTGN